MMSSHKEGRDGVKHELSEVFRRAVAEFRVADERFVVSMRDWMAAIDWHGTESFGKGMPAVRSRIQPAERRQRLLDFRERLRLAFDEVDREPGTRKRVASNAGHPTANAEAREASKRAKPASDKAPEVEPMVIDSETAPSTGSSSVAGVSMPRAARRGRSGLLDAQPQPSARSDLLSPGQAFALHQAEHTAGALPQTGLTRIAEESANEASTNLANVLDTTASFDVGGPELVEAVNTYLCGGFIGHSFKLANSTWGPAYSDGKRSQCVIDGYLQEMLLTDGAKARGVVVRTVRDGCHYAFELLPILRILGSSRERAETELDVLTLRARLAAGFDASQSDTPLPPLISSSSPLSHEHNRLQRIVFLSTLAGSSEAITSLNEDQLHERFERIRQQRRDRSGRSRPVNDEELREERRHRPRGHRNACNAAKLFAFDSEAHDQAAYDSVGALGECDVCDDAGCSCADRFKCTYCAALLFRGEAAKAPSVGKHGTKWCGGKFCCSKGAVDLAPVERDETIEALWHEHDELMIENSRRFNNALTLASAPVKTPSPPGGGWNPSVVIQGKLHHKVGPLAFGEGEAPRYAQLYVHDPAAEDDTVAKQRYASMLLPKNTSKKKQAAFKALLHDLHVALADCNSYVKDFITAGEIFQQEETVSAQFVIDPDKAPADADKRVYSSNYGRRTFNEVSVLHDEQPNGRSIMLRWREGGVYETDETSRAYDPLHFVLLFPCGDDGWHPYIPKSSAAAADADNEPDESAQQPRSGRGKQISPCQYYAHRLQVRELDDDEADGGDDGPRLDDALNRAGRLFQEYCCMALAKTEAQKLRWQATHQKEIRAELYQNLADHVNAHDHTSGEPLQAGKRVVLASSFTGGPRDQHQRYQDAMAVVRKKGKPSFFITMTCNQKWPEIVDALPPGHKAENRPDITARVFKLKLNQMLHELYKDGIFGYAIAHLHVIEFQQRGLPHAHIVIVLHTSDRPRTVDDIDGCVRAELPAEPSRDDFSSDEEYETAHARFEELTELVCTHMLHGPCGAANPKCSCMEDGQCKKHFPKKFNKHTTFSEDQIYPDYQRRSPADGGPTCKPTSGSYKDREVDSSVIVPYSPYLLLKYRCHLNVEICFSVGGVKYLYKYVYKGPDRAMVAVRESDDGLNEIELYQDMRKIGAAEGCWRTFSFDMYDREPHVVRLQSHMPNLQPTYFVDGDEQSAADKGAPPTSLTLWLDFIRTQHPDVCRPRSVDGQITWSALYPDYPEQYHWDKNKKRWKEYTRRPANKPIGRVYGVHPNAGDAFYLRTLLHHVPACELELSDVNEEQCVADQFTLEAFKYAGGVKHESYKAVCAARGLLQGDGEWFAVLEDAKETKSAKAIRELYVYILKYNSPQDPVKLFDTFCESMSEDFTHELKQRDIAFTDVEMRARVLLAVEERLESFGESLAKHNLVLTKEDRTLGEANARTARRSREPKEVLDELIPEEKRADLAALAAEREATLLDSQRVIHNAVLEAIKHIEGRCLFVDAPGGTGKTYTFNTILAAVRSKGDIALAVASSGIAAILLELGRTFHSRFKASRRPAEGQSLDISAQTALAKLIRKAKVILWDEAAMANRYHLEALDITLCDLMQNELPFGGKVIVLGGDFRQTLPIVKMASRAQTVDVALTRSSCWHHFAGKNTFKLTENMRIEAARRTAGSSMDAEALQQLESFAKWLLAIGEGIDPTTDELEMITLPKELCLPEGCNLDKLVDWVYPDLATNCYSSEWLSGRAILSTLNSLVDEANDKISESFPGRLWRCVSADRARCDDDVRYAPEEVLNSLDVAGIPKHELHLKPNMPVMLLRNLSPSDGLCNGTRLLVKEVINGRLLKAEIATGKHRGDIVYIPRIQLSPDDDVFPFQWSRRQFPVRVAFAMTINKAQGQTLQCVGVYLPQPCFSHGQLYVAASCVGLPANIRFAVDADEASLFRTRNVVYKEALTNQPRRP